MCIGVPMQVVTAHEHFAQCRRVEVGHEPISSSSKVDEDQLVEVDTSLTGPLRPGAYVLSFLGAAREEIEIENALQIANALAALEVGLGGDHNVDHLFADLVDREPELPAHLQDQLKDTSKEVS